MTFRPAHPTSSLEARLRAFPFASQLEPNTKVRLLEVARCRHFPVNTVLVRPGQECPGVPLVERGSVRVVRRATKELRLYDVTPGETCVLALTSVLRQTPYPTEATAVAGTDAILVPAGDLRQLFSDDAVLQRYVVDIFAGRLNDLMDLAHEVAFESVEARLARLLLHEAGPRSGEITLTHAKLATMLGTAREVVSRSLDKMQRRGWVELARRRVVLRDIKALRALVGAAPRSVT